MILNRYNFIMDQAPMCQGGLVGKCRPCHHEFDVCTTADHGSKSA